MPKQKPMKWPLPQELHPRDTICFQINVPNEIYYLNAFYGAIFLLSKPYAWGDDPDHKALVVGSVWRAIFDKLIAGNCTIPAIPGSAGAEGDDNLIRQDPDNPCLLQTSIDGVNWCTFADLSLCVAGPGQPGGQPVPQPPAGGCANYHGEVAGSGLWLMPTVVSTGDTIQVSNVLGATNDGATINWYCGDGDQFFAGACVGFPVTVGTDPLPAVFHQKLIAKIGSTFYDVFGGTFTVPSGHTNDQVVFQINADPLSACSGNLSFDIIVCNNQSGVWTSTLDFMINPYSSFVGGAFASWAMGSGYQGVVNGGVPNWAQLDITLDSCDIDSVVMTYDALTPGGSSSVVFFQINSTGYGTPGATIAGNPVTYLVTDPAAAATLLQAIVSTGTTGGVDHIQKLFITGHGAKPSQLP